MRSAFLSLVAVASALFAFGYPAEGTAKCAGYSMESWPKPGATLPANRPMIILDGYMNARSVIQDIAQAPPNLTSEDESVALETVDILSNQRAVDQVVLRAKQDLQPGETYALKDDRLIQKGSRIRLLPDGGGSTPVTWTAGSADGEAPTFDGPLKQTGSSYRRLGCGPSEHVFVEPSLENDGSDGVVYRARLTSEADSDDTQEFWVVPDDSGRVEIGHGMCGGEFELTRGRQYELELEAVDGAGNRSSSSKTVEVVAPDP